MTISQFGKQSLPYKEPNNLLQESTIQAYSNSDSIISAVKHRLLHNHEIITLPSCEFLAFPMAQLGSFILLGYCAIALGNWHPRFKTV